MIWLKTFLYLLCKMVLLIIFIAIVLVLFISAIIPAVYVALVFLFIQLIVTNGITFGNKIKIKKLEDVLLKMKEEENGKGD